MIGKVFELKEGLTNDDDDDDDDCDDCGGNTSCNVSIINFEN